MHVIEWLLVLVFKEDYNFIKYTPFVSERTKDEMKSVFSIKCVSMCNRNSCEYYSVHCTVVLAGVI